VASALCDTTTTAALRFVAGQAASASVSALAREVLRSMLLHRLAIAAPIVLGLAAVAGAGLLGRSLTTKDEPNRRDPAPKVAVTAPARPGETGKTQPPSPARVPTVRRLSPWGERVERSIREGVRFLKQQQRPDGSWPDIDGDANSGTTSLALLALLTAGEKPDSPAIRKGLEFLRSFRPDVLNSTYAIGLQTAVFAAAEPERDKLRILANVEWLESAQIKPGDAVAWPGSWSYGAAKRRNGDNSNTQYALLGLHAAVEAGVLVKPHVWTLARAYWTRSQKKDGSWSYTPESPASTASMSCAGISSLIFAGVPRLEGQEFLQGEAIRNCGKGRVNPSLQSGIDWLTRNFRADENHGAGVTWRFYYLYGLERAGRLTGLRFFGPHDWYRQGAEVLVASQDKLTGAWQGSLMEHDQLLATSFAVLFLARGRAPVLINKLHHAPLDDWDLDPDDVRNLVDIVGRDWKSQLDWQVVDSQTATLPDLQRAPILFLSGHKAPEFSSKEKMNLRDYIDRGGFLLADACCGEPGFDQGFRRLMKELFPEEESTLRPLAEDHHIWRSRHLIDPAANPLWGIWRGSRMVVVYSPKDLSCYWNQADHDPRNPVVARAIKIGQNVVDYVTKRELPPDKLAFP
jgi:Domain of unknown function (DUF4159)/Prenyltransferase and squalene oxidase repeat